MPLKLLIATVAFTVASLPWGGLGWCFTLPAVILAAGRWPRLALLWPLCGLALSGLLYAAEQALGAPPTVLPLTVLVYLSLGYAGVTLQWRITRLQQRLDDTQTRAVADQRVLETMAQLARLSATGGLDCPQVARRALPLVAGAVAIQAALLNTRDGEVHLESLLPQAPLPEWLAPGVAVPADLWRAHHALIPTFVNGAAADPHWHAGPRAAPAPYALLPLQLPGAARVSLLVIQEAPDGRWGLTERELLLAVTQTLRVAAEREQHLRSLDTLANQDALTGCLNRHAFRRALQRLDQHTTAYCVAVMDLDGFKALNDRLGHARGDELLCQFATAVRDAFFARDALYRLGGDEFALVLPDVPSVHLGTLLDKMQRLTAQLTRGEGPRVGVSVGVAHVCEAPDAQAVLALADRRMYTAKAERHAAALGLKSPAPELEDETLLLLSSALEARDRETHGHARRVTHGAERLGERLGLSAEQLQALRRGAFLHDIGKLTVPDRILLKPGALDADEWAVMRTHPAAGCALACRVPTLSPLALDVIRSHHERWDGSGYPDGLAGEEIPWLERIFAVVDVFDALTSERPYRAAWTVARALDELTTQTGRQFDPRVVQAFVALVTEQEVLGRGDADRPFGSPLEVRGGG